MPTIETVRANIARSVRIGSATWSGNSGSWRRDGGNLVYTPPPEPLPMFVLFEDTAGEHDLDYEEFVTSAGSRAVRLRDPLLGPEWTLAFIETPPVKPGAW